MAAGGNARVSSPPLFVAVTATWGFISTVAQFPSGTSRPATLPVTVEIRATLATSNPLPLEEEHCFSFCACLLTREPRRERESEREERERGRSLASGTARSSLRDHRATGSLVDDDRSETQRFFNARR